MFDSYPTVVLHAEKMTYHEFISKYFDPSKFLEVQYSHEFTEGIIRSSKDIHTIPFTMVEGEYVKISKNATYFHGKQQEQFGSVTDLLNYFDHFNSYKNRVVRFKFGATNRIVITKISQITDCHVEGYDLTESKSIRWEKKYIQMDSIQFLDVNY